MTDSASLGEQDVLLALDTSGRVGSVAVGKGPAVLAQVSLTEHREHAARLIPAIDAVLSEASTSLGDLAGIVVGEGPGSFTGVRVAAATAKGLAHALGIPLWAISSLTAAALASEVGPVRYVLFDARGDRVYGACYGVGTVAVQELVAPHGGTLRDALAGDVPPGAVFTGEAAELHMAAIEAAGFPVEAAQGELLAVGLLRYLTRHMDASPVLDPSSWEPAYIRASSAERLWSK
ncbi:MAG: tRNA (adenosine(37)-N6)-threonylcarbamoyltransferase complex dimerization subunit type 1 TsaB [Gemmatimonadota bacterium]|nr:tRNA (adenosine(37)-N6)-threonylcarbamoyltransferase complex dimerization subunit type 1 TsaB [Gemmatimonadota bacterium]